MQPKDEADEAEGESTLPFWLLPRWQSGESGGQEGGEERLLSKG